MDPEEIRIVIDNPNGFTVYMAGDENDCATYSGKPYLWVDGQVIQFGEEAGNNGFTRVEATDSTSITNYGEQILQVPDTISVRTTTTSRARRRPARRSRRPGPGDHRHPRRR